MNKYNEYFDVDKGYRPEINPSSIKDENLKWEDTFPHKTFIELLKTVERMLARGTNTDKKGIWIEGAYGTGKSRIAWTLKNIIECSEEEMNAYFDKYPDLKRETDLRDKLNAAKEKKIITVSRYAAGGIDTTRKLIMAVFDSVTKALKENGIDYKGERTLRGKIASWLSSEEHKKIFEILAGKSEYRGLGSFSGKSVDNIVVQLKNLNLNVDDLLNDILALADNEGITAFQISMDDLISWLSDVIDENDLKAIVFIWDEFSSYFKANKNVLDEFQRLAELSNEKPFDLIIVTHMSGSIFGENEQSGKIIRDRFVRKEITMPDNVAFELIRYALKTKKAAAKEWEELAEDLNSAMPQSRKAVSEVTKVSEETLTKILPIHPMAALLLKNISLAFASNQRSMFNFIKTESEDLHAFQWFIANRSPDNNDLLTIDYLWDFFYEKGTDEYGFGAGRSNLDFLIKTILDSFILNETSLFEEEKTVLKTILMMQAISQKFGDALELLQPTDKNINLAFEGTAFANGYACNLAKRLVEKGILFEKPGKNPSYAAAAVSGDQAAIDKIKKRLKSETRTAELIKDYDFASLLLLTPGQKFRYLFTPVTSENFTSIINKISNEQKDYHIRGVICCARNEEEQSKLRELIAKAKTKQIYNSLTIIDASSNIMGIDRFEQWIDAYANQEYWRLKDPDLAEDMKGKADAVIREWKKLITEGDFVCYPFCKADENNREVINCPKMSDLQNVLANNVLKVYPLSFDNAKVSEQFFATTKLPSGAKCGIEQRTGDIYQANAVNALLGSAWQNAGYTDDISLPISKLKNKIDSFIGECLEKDVRISIGEIFDELVRYGFMPCNLYAFLTGFLLKEYIQDQYRYGVGINGDEGGKMTSDKLGDYIGEYIKNLNTPIKNYREKYIEIMTQNQKTFIDFATYVFDTGANISVEQTANKLRYRLKELGYPIWCFKKIDRNNLGVFIDKIGEIANSKNNESVSQLADTLGRMMTQVPSSIEALKQLLTPKNGAIALEAYLREDIDEGIIFELSNKIGMINPMADVLEKISSGDALWLWDQGTGIEEIRKLITEYKIISQSNRLGMNGNEWYSCMNAWIDAVKFMKIPCSALEIWKPDLKVLWGHLKAIKQKGDLAYEKRQSFLKQIEEKFASVSEALEKKELFFEEEYSTYLKDFSKEEMHTIYSKLPTTSFEDDLTTYIQNLVLVIQQMRQEQAKFKLKSEWIAVAESENPIIWSKKHRTPILVMVAEKEQVYARRLFMTLNSNTPSAEDVAFSLEYILSKPEFLKSLKNKEDIENAFNKGIIGKYDVFLHDNEAVRDWLEKTVPNDIYDWYPNKTVEMQIEKIAKDKYFQGGNETALKKIDVMDDAVAKEYLKRLIKENMTVGIEIILGNC